MRTIGLQMLADFFFKPKFDTVYVYICIPWMSKHHFLALYEFHDVILPKAYHYPIGTIIS